MRRSLRPGYISTTGPSQQRDDAPAHEQRAERASESQRPSRVDHRLQAKRWEAVAAQAIEVVKRWDGRHEGDNPGSEALDVDVAIDVAAASDRTARLARIVDR